MSFAPQLARLLDADYSVLAKSGEGVVHNWGTGWPDRGLHTEERYPWTFYGANKTAGNTIWQSKRLPASAIILALGTNDFSDAKRRPYHEEYVQAWTSLMRRVHAMNPEAPSSASSPCPLPSRHSRGSGSKRPASAHGRRHCSALHRAQHKRTAARARGLRRRRHASDEGGLREARRLPCPAHRAAAAQGLKLLQTGEARFPTARKSVERSGLLFYL